LRADAREEKAMKTIIGFVFVAGLITPALAWDCGSQKVVASSVPAAPVQTAEAPAPTQTK
jgi:hypothetical protein